MQIQSLNFLDTMISLKNKLIGFKNLKPSYKLKK